MQMSFAIIITIKQQLKRRMGNYSHTVTVTWIFSKSGKTIITMLNSEAAVIFLRSGKSLVLNNVADVWSPSVNLSVDGGGGITV